MADYFDNDLLLAFIVTDTRKEKTKLHKNTKRDSTKRDKKRHKKRLNIAIQCLHGRFK